VRLYSRPGNDLTRQFPLIAEALARLRTRSGIIDGEAVDGAGAFWSPEGTKVPSGGI
jgi:ATP-dependent DNA ligase